MTVLLKTKKNSGGPFEIQIILFLTHFSNDTVCELHNSECLRKATVTLPTLVLSFQNFYTVLPRNTAILPANFALIDTYFTKLWNFFQVGVLILRSLDACQSGDVMKQEVCSDSPEPSMRGRTSACW